MTKVSIWVMLAWALLAWATARGNTRVADEKGDLTATGLLLCAVPFWLFVMWLWLG